MGGEFSGSEAADHHLVQAVVLSILVQIISCQPRADCRTVRCGGWICPDGSRAPVPPGQCCPDPSLCRRRCGEIACILRVCNDGSVPPTPPDQCCPDFSLCPKDNSLIKFGKY